MAATATLHEPFNPGLFAAAPGDPPTIPPPVVPPTLPPVTGGGSGIADLPPGVSTAYSTLVPGQYPVGLAGNAYLLDYKLQPLQHQPIPLLKQQLDSSALPGEQSLSHDILWRRPQESWHHGAGQNYVDKADSSFSRFRKSKGINVWEKWEIGLLQDVDKRYDAASVTIKGMAASQLRYYIIDGNSLKWTIGLFAAGAPTWETVTVPNPNSMTSIADMASDGRVVYLAYWSNGVYQTDIGATTATLYSSVSNAYAIGYARGRLLAASQTGNVRSLYNLTASGAPPAPLIESSSVAWGFFAESQAHIYIGANTLSEFKGLVYKTAVKPDGTSLDIPSVALELPDGETITALKGYLGFMIIGTNIGIRVAQVGADGNLTLGGVIRTPQPVRAIEPQGKYVWYGWSDFDSVSSGLGRMDLSEFTAPLVPAYASDLMAPSRGTISSISTLIFDTLVFTIQDTGNGISPGVYTTARDRKVSSGYVDSGLITFGLPDPKVAFFLDVRYKSMSGKHRAYVATADGGVFHFIGEHTANTSLLQFPIGQFRSDQFEVRAELFRDTASPNLGPVITRQTLKVETAADTGQWIIAPLILSARDYIHDTSRARDPQAEFQLIQDLRAAQTYVIWQEGAVNYQVVVDDYQWNAMKDRDGKFEGTCVVKMKVVR